MKNAAIALLAILIIQGSWAQEKDKDQEKVEEKNFGVKFSGFVKNDFFYDTRQSVAAREGHFLLWPSPEYLDENGEDINAGTNFNMLAIQSRLSLALSGPDALGARTSGLIEGDFFAQLNDNIDLFRLRHAFVKLTWTHIEVLAGQYWNPLFVTDCFPGTVSFNTGTPLQSFSRNPQIRISFNAGGLKLTLAALSQRDYASVGPAGTTSMYLRNSAIPDMHLQAQYGFNNETGTGLLAGAGMAYKTLVPRLSSEPVAGEVYKVNEKVGGLTAIVFARMTTRPLTAKLQLRYGENITDLLGISGFAVTNIIDPVTGLQEYSPLRSMTLWAEVHSNGNPQLGLFGGYTVSNGTRDERESNLYPVYGLATNIRSLYRIAPRIFYNIGKLRLALELEYTSAAYGSDYNAFYIPDSTSAVGNLRVLMAIYYFF
ncbi:MAG: hypothetical protein R6W31_09950 [Bacteroidales bacterium]